MPGVTGARKSGEAAKEVGRAKADEVLEVNFCILSMLRSKVSLLAMSLCFKAIGIKLMKEHACVICH
jgi:hypothetical protein